MKTVLSYFIAHHPNDERYASKLEELCWEYLPSKKRRAYGLQALEKPPVLADQQVLFVLLHAHAAEDPALEQQIKQYSANTKKGFIVGMVLHDHSAFEATTVPAETLPPSFATLLAQQKAVLHHWDNDASALGQWLDLDPEPLGSR